MGTPLSAFGALVTWIACIGTVFGITGATYTEVASNPPRPQHPVASLPAAAPAQDPEVPIPVNSVQIRSTPTTTTTVVAYEGEGGPEPVVVPDYKGNSEARCDMWIETAMVAGWQIDELPRLNYLMWRESRCDPDAHNPDDPMGGSNGLVQINQFWCKTTQYNPGGWLQIQGVLRDCDELYEPLTNLLAARAIYEHSGWRPWGWRN